MDWTQVSCTTVIHANHYTKLSSVLVWNYKLLLIHAWVTLSKSSNSSNWPKFLYFELPECLAGIFLRIKLQNILTYVTYYENNLKGEKLNITTGRGNNANIANFVCLWKNSNGDFYAYFRVIQALRSKGKAKYDI